MSWTPEKTRLLIMHWCEGHCTQDIAHRLEFTSNKVAGKLHRLGLTQGVNRSTALSRQLAAGIPGWSAEELHVLLHFTLKGYIVEGLAKLLGRSPFQITTVLIQIESRLVRAQTLSDLPATVIPTGCRYPIGNPKDPDFKYCDKPRRASSSYCETHHKECYKPRVTNGHDKQAESAA